MGVVALKGGKNIFISAVKKAEEDDFWVMRFYNLSPRRSQTELKFYNQISKIKLLNLNEEIVGPLNRKKIFLIRMRLKR